jgi:Carboxypeptidase regulatory-like domain/TonB dependent receptor
MTKNLRAAFAMALLAIGCLLTIAPARAQSVYGSVFGTVTDKTGAVVPGATVTVTDEAKGTSEVAITNDTGDYTVSHLVPDTYDLKVEVKGFETFVSKGITVLADTSPRVDAALTIGGGGTTVTVDADTVPQLKTDRADVSTVFDSQQVSDLPVEGQNFTNLQLLLPGAQLLGWSHAADENPQASRQIQVDGQAFGGVAYELDGTDNQDPILGIIVVNPSLDSVTEAKITTQNFDAELGKAVSAVMTVQTKSGSNSFHGSAYDFRTGNANLARDPFSQPPGPDAIPPGVKNKFGGSVGGRVIKDKLFFFGAYEGQRQKVGTSDTATLPSQLATETCLGNEVGPSGIAGCDFSQYATQFGAAGTLYQNVTNPDGTVTGTPFPGNVIPAGLVSQQWKNLLKVLEPYTKLENPNSPAGGLGTNYSAGGTGLFNSNLWTVRVDDTISQKQSAFVRFSRWTNVLSGAQMFDVNNVGAGGEGFGIGGYGGQSSSADDSVAVGTDYVVNPKLITDLRLGYLRYNILDEKNDAATEFANTLGIPGINLGTPTTGGSPGFEFASLPQGVQPWYGDGLGISRCNCPLIEREDQFQIVNNWTKTLGNHSIKIGADLRYGRNLRVPSDSDRDGVMQFNAGSTSDAGASGTGMGFGTIALGDVTSMQRYVSTSDNAKEFQKRIFFYLQDTWRVSSKFTANLGVRWEGYYPEAVNGPGNGSLLSLNDGYLHVAGIGGVPTDMGWNLDEKKQFEPRIGLAYQLNPKTVIRGGYGRSFDIGVFGSVFGHVVTQNLPVLANQSLNSSGTQQAFCLGSPTDNPGCNLANLSTPQPAVGGPAGFVPPAVPASGLLPNPGYTVNSKARPNPMQFPTLDAWNLSMQRSLTPTLSLTVAYVGNKGTHTLSDGDGNNTMPNEEAIQIGGQYKFGNQTFQTINGQTLHWDPSAPSTPTSSGATSNPLYLQRFYGAKLQACSDPAYDSSATGANVPAGTGWCGWSQQISYYGDDQNTNFNALQITLAQQTWHGLNANFNYQFARANDHLSPYETWDPSIAYGADSNVRHHAATLYGSYDLPFGKGKQFFTGANHAEDLLLGGYEISGTLSGSSGLPFSLGLNGCSYNYTNSAGKVVSAPDYPNGPTSEAPCYPLVAAGSKLHTNLSSYIPGTGWTFYQPVTLGSSGFSEPGLDELGNSGHNNYFGPKFFNTDLSLQKTFAIWENVVTKFRFDAYNAVNHINPGNPGGNIQNVGSITGEAPGPGPRQLEFSLRVQF